MNSLSFFMENEEEFPDEKIPIARFGKMKYMVGCLVNFIQQKMFWRSLPVWK